MVSAVARRAPLRRCIARLLHLCAPLLVAGCVGSVGDPNGAAPGGSPGAMPGVSNPGPAGAQGGGAAPGCQPDSTPTRIWRLSDEQYSLAVADLLPGVTVPDVTTPGESKAEFISLSDVYPVSGALIIDLRSAAKSVAAAAIQNLPQRLGCPTADAACAQAYVERLASRAFRRPLEPADRAALGKVFAFGAQKAVGDGVRLSIGGGLQAPALLYRTE